MKLRRRMTSHRERLRHCICKRLSAISNQLYRSTITTITTTTAIYYIIVLLIHASNAKREYIKQTSICFSENCEIITKDANGSVFRLERPFLFPKTGHAAAGPAVIADRWDSTPFSSFSVRPDVNNPNYTTQGLHKWNIKARPTH